MTHDKNGDCTKHWFGLITELLKIGKNGAYRLKKLLIVSIVFVVMNWES
jgi:hypothetical protein